jgi:hypothetical protein
LDRGRHPYRYEGDEVAALLRGLKMAVIAVVSAVLTAVLVIGWGDRERDRANPHYGDLVTVAMNSGS